VNLAARLEDGQQVVVPRRGAAPVAAGGEDAQGPISLSSATVEQLDTIDGIGPTLAARIVEYREAHGGFRSVEELGEVDGIGEVRLEALRQAVQP
jgi:competence protein ComEA